MDLAFINLPAVLIAAVAAFTLGALWYSSVLFGKVWQKEVGLSDKDLQTGNMPAIFGTSFVLIALMVVGLAWVFSKYPVEQLDLMFGLTRGALVGLFFAATSVGINQLYQRGSIKLWLIDAGYQVAFLALAGAILGLLA